MYLRHFQVITMREQSNDLDKHYGEIEQLLRLQATSGQSTHSTAEVLRAALHPLGTCGSAELTVNLGKVWGKHRK